MIRWRLLFLLLFIYTSTAAKISSALFLTKDDSLSFNQISDSLIKNEVSLFTIAGTLFYNTDSLNRLPLTEIPIRACSASEVYLSWSTFTSKVSTFIHLYFEKQDQIRMLDSIFLVTHSHFLVKFPKSAFQNLPQNNICEFSGGGKKSEYFSPFYKAFYSQDLKRLYIYMQGESTTQKYEVTWIIIGDVYHGRIVDSIPIPNIPRD